MIQACEDLLRAGRIQEAVHLLRSVNTRQLAGELRWPVAKLCRRAGAYALGLKILSPLVSEAISSLNYRGQELEIAEYAILLQRCGVIDEALRILQRLNPEVVPETGLFVAFCLISRWEYAAAVRYLHDYIGRCEDPYARVIGQVNLAAAHVNGRETARARELLRGVISETTQRKFHRLLANAHELSAELSIQENELSQAEIHLGKAGEILRNEQVHDQLFVQLWRALLLDLKSGRPERLKEFRAQAVARREWENVREADLHRLKLAPDAERLHALYAGTPHAAYRRRILRELGLSESPSTEFQWGGGAGPLLDLRTGHLENPRGTRYPLAGTLLRLLTAVSRDFYRPRPVGALFSEVYPEQHFDIFTSPGRVHQLILRTRAFLRESGLPLVIARTGGTYTMELQGAATVILSLATPQAPSSAVVFARRAREVLLEDAAFTHEDFRRAVGLAKSQVNTLLAECQREGLIRRLGRGRGTRYRFVSI